jgi:small-conductance mechanosensitive channel
VNGALTALLAMVVAIGAAIVLVEAIHLVVTRLGRRSPLLADLARTAHRPFRAVVIIYAVQQALRSGVDDFPGRDGVLHALVLAIIAGLAWLVAAFLLVLEDVTLARWRTDVPDNLKARRLRTQVVMIRRVTVAAIVVVAIGVMLMTFPDVRTLGTSVLASAGVVSVIAALAAQSTLGNVFAGLQLAFSDAVRIDDVVVVEGEWGKIEELTLTYVALQIWDDRRLILPTSYFTSKPFQNWTRRGSAVLGTAEIDVDWATSVEPLRAELRAVCEGTELWDGRVCVLQVTDAVGGMIRLRALVSAHDAPSLWDLRCLVRERLVSTVWEHQKDALPRVRATVAEESVTAPPAHPAQPADQEASADARVFGGGDDGDRRGARFGGPADSGTGTGSGTGDGTGDGARPGGSDRPTAVPSADAPGR